MKTTGTHWLLVAIVIAAVIQISLAQRHSLWADEVFSLATATGHSLEHPAAKAQPQLGDFVEPQAAVPAAQFRSYVAHENPPAGPGRVVRAVLLSDTSPPLYYLLLAAWTIIFGTSDLALRFFSIVWSLASLPLIAAIARRVSGERAAITTCLLFAFCPLLAYYSSEGRMYSLLLFLALALAWTSLVLQERGPRLSYCSLWIVVSLAGFLTHYFFLFPWIANIVFLFVQPGKLTRRWLLLCAVTVCVLFLPWVWLASGFSKNWRVTHDWLHMRPPQFHRARAFVAQFTQFFSSGGRDLWRTPRWARFAATALFATAGALALWRMRWQLFSGKRLLLWLWFAAACGGPSVLDLIQHTYTANHPRYALGGLPAACLIGGIVLTCAPAAYLALIILTWVPNLSSIYRQRSRDLEPFRELAQEISSTASASDLVLMHSIPSGVIGLARYLNTDAALASWIGQLGNRQVPDSIRALVNGHTRVLLIKLHEVGEPAPEEEWLRANGVVTAERWFDAARLIDFKPRNGPAF